MRNFHLGLLITAACFVGSTAIGATLIHEYTFDDGTANDSVGSLNGLLIGGATISGGELQLDGVDDYVELPGHAVPTGGIDFSLVLTATLDSRTPDLLGEMISQGVSGGPGFYLGYDPVGEIRITDNFPTSTTMLSFPSDAASHTYVLTSGDLFGTQFYIDGTNLFSNSELILGSGGENTRFGRQFDPYTEFFDGSIDYVGIYSGELMNGQVPDNTSPVPLPAGLPLLFAGLGGFGLIARRRRKVIQPNR